MLRKIIFFLWLVQNSLFAFSKDFNDNAANLIRDFITKLRNNERFSYVDEIKYFPEKSFYSAVILFQLGYIDEQGRWLKRKPKVSFLCELIRMKRDVILLQDCDEMFFLTGKTHSFSLKTQNFYLWPIDTLILCVQKCNHKQNAKTIVFYYRIPQKKLDFPIMVNGVSLASEIGFSINDRGIPELTDDLVSKLRKIENLTPK